MFKYKHRCHDYRLKDWIEREKIHVIIMMQLLIFYVIYYFKLIILQIFTNYRSYTVFYHSTKARLYKNKYVPFDRYRYSQYRRRDEDDDDDKLEDDELKFNPYTTLEFVTKSDKISQYRKRRHEILGAVGDATRGYIQ